MARRRPVHEHVRHVDAELGEEQVRREEAADVDLRWVGDAVAVVGEVDAEQRVRRGIDCEDGRHRDLVHLRVGDRDRRAGRTGHA